MSEYTPTRQELIGAWVQAHSIEGWGGPVDLEGMPKTRITEGHRAIAEIERAAAEKALIEAAEDYEGYLVNPELPIEDQPSPVARQYKSTADRLRKRAAAYRNVASCHPWSMDLEEGVHGE